MAFRLIIDAMILEELQEIEERNEMRLERRMIRDLSNPFDLPNGYFQQLFRFNKDMARDIIEIISPHLINSVRNTKIPKHLKILAVLYFFAHGCYQKNAGQDFKIGLCQASVSACISEITNIFVNHLMREYVKFPVTDEEIIIVKHGFTQKFNVGGILGCIDGTHVAIKAPPVTDENYPPAVYFNRKGFYSINVQLLCDSNLRIISANARFPGSCHDSAIWATSVIRRHLVTKYENGERNSWLLGDSGYPLEPWLLTPIENAVAGTPEARYTRHHCLVRNTVERCIGVLKMRFRCLTKTRALMYHPLKAAQIIYSCIILHNLAIKYRLDEYEDNDLNNLDNIDQNFPVINDIINPDVGGNVLLAESRRIRNNFIRTYFM